MNILCTFSLDVASIMKANYKVENLLGVFTKNKYSSLFARLFTKKFNKWDLMTRISLSTNSVSFLLTINGRYNELLNIKATK